MDDLYALEGGGSATAWQRKHNRRKAREAALKVRRSARAEAKADLKKRTKKWRAKWKAQAAANKAAGLPPPGRHGRPREIRRTNMVDMSGWRFGRLAVLRVAPTSKNGGQRCRTWWVRCDCGSPERRVNGTSLRQGNVQSCGCLKRERVKAYWASGEGARLKAARRAHLKKPIAWQLLRLRRQYREGSKEAKLLSKTRNLLIAYELKLGLRKPRKGWKTDRYRLEAVAPRTIH